MRFICGSQWPMYLPLSQTYHLDNNEKTQNENTKRLKNND